MKSLIFLSALALICVAHSYAQPKSILTDIIKYIIEHKRDAFANVTVDALHLSERATINNVTIVNLENFVVLNLTGGEGLLSLKILNATVDIPWLGVEGIYDFVEIDIPALNVTLNGTGKISVQLDNIWLTVALDCELKGLTFDIKDFHDLGIHVNAVSKLDIEGLSEDAANAISAHVPDIVNNNYQQYVEAHKDAILAVLNNILGSIV